VTDKSGKKLNNSSFKPPGCHFPFKHAFFHNVLHFSSPEVNFINILDTHFLYESELSSFSLNMFGFVIFGVKILYEKHSRKTLMNLAARSQTQMRFKNP